MEFRPHNYQVTAIDWVMDHPRCCLFLDMGLGKSVITLTAIARLIDSCEVERALVVAPKKVAESTWTAEAAKWSHLHWLRVAAVLGDIKSRRTALEAEADVYVIGRDNFVWLMREYGGHLPFDTIIIDELTGFKSPTSQRFRAMRLATQSASRMIGLTGTPAPNGLVDLWAQIYCIDRGRRLGQYVTRYRQTYFNEVKWNHITVRCTPRKGAEEEIRRLLSDICLSMQADDYLELPDMMEHDVMVTLPPALAKSYTDFERDNVMQLASGDEVTAASAAALMNKLSQYANGAIYDDEHTAREVHTEKLDRLAEIVEGAAGAPVLVFYQYRHDIPRITKRLIGLRVVTYEGVSELEAWNAGEIDVLLAHPASTAYGLNMQQGGHYIVWFGTGWNLELYQQANARLHRQGQRHPVVVYRLLTAGTVDERAAAALRSKDSVQRSLLNALSDLKAKYQKQWQKTDSTSV